MRHAPPLALTVLLYVCLAGEAAAQREVEPYQTFSAGLGWGAIRPIGETGLDGRVADGNTSMHFGLDLEIRQAELVFLYGRADADAADTRQHLGLSGGVRIRPILERRLRPYAGAGVGLLWAEPRVAVANELDRELVLRGEGHLGLEWMAVPGLRWFAEYRALGANLTAVSEAPGCAAGFHCLSRSSGRVLHMGHSAWLGMRIKMF